MYNMIALCSYRMFPTSVGNCQQKKKDTHETRALCAVALLREYVHAQEEGNTSTLLIFRVSGELIGGLVGSDGMLMLLLLLAIVNNHLAVYGVEV
jgi:hypothetical protein